MTEFLMFRPHICPDLHCQCIWTTWSREGHEEGRSWDCVGRLATPHTFWWAQTKHVNSHCWCVYTPLKGLLKFLIRTDDVAVFFQTLGTMLLEEDPEQLEIILRPLVYALSDKGIKFHLQENKP